MIDDEEMEISSAEDLVKEAANIISNSTLSLETEYSSKVKFHDVTRVEVIGENGREYASRELGDVYIDLQDDNRTMKIFVKRG